MSTETYPFGRYRISAAEVFYTSNLSFAFVNISPVVPGHVLVCPRREVKRVADLSTEEIIDLWVIAQKVGAKLEQHHNASSPTYGIQDGPQAGQTVPHVHIHILPRKAENFLNNDEVYKAIDEKEKKQALDLDKGRTNRPLEEMAAEATIYRALFS